MTREEYTDLFHRAQLNLVAFRKVNDCDVEIMKMVEMAVAAEREACAKVCEDQENKIVKSHPARVEFDPNSYMAKFCAASIRARGEK